MTSPSTGIWAGLLVAWAAVGSASAADPGAAEPAPATPGDPLHFADGPVDLKFSVEIGAQGVTGGNAFWGLAQVLSPASDYPTRHLWLESYGKFGLAATYPVYDPLALYAGAAIIASGTLGKDYFEERSDGKVLPENAFLGLRWRNDSGDWAVDLSGGQQSYLLGNQLLLAVGAGNGFERGCLTTFPYRAWEVTGIGRVTWKQVALEGFYLDPNELDSNDLKNRLAGVTLKWEPAPGQFAGLAFVKALESQYPYAQAPVTIVPNGREGLEAYDVYGKWAPTEGPWAGFSLLGEAVIERNHRVRMEGFGAGLEIGYRFATLPFQPRLSYSPRYFSGDDPGTRDTLEGFDPLFYMASPDTWASGGSSSLAFLNANIIAHRARLELVLSPRNLLNLNYWYVQAAEVNSPLQFGQAARLTMSGGTPVLVSGVPDRELSHEFYMDYVHLFGQHVFLTVGLAGSFPGEGIRELVPRGAQDWWGGLVNLTVRY